MLFFVQNKMDVSSLDILLQCAEAPVPDLGQNSQPENSNSQGTTGKKTCIKHVQKLKQSPRKYSKKDVLEHKQNILHIIFWNIHKIKCEY